MIRKIGITGGIGAGKSVVSGVLRLRGYAVYDCDFEARRLMTDSSDICCRLCELGCAGMYANDGSLDRRALATRLFSDDSFRMEVNRIVHKAVKEDFLTFAAHRYESGDRVVFCESAIMAEASMIPMFDFIWVVTAPEHLRIERVMSRNSATEAEVMERIRSQREESRKLSECGIPLVSLDNSGQTMLLPALDKALRQCLYTG